MATRSVSIFKNPVPANGARVASLSEFASARRYSTGAVHFPDTEGAEVQLAFPIPSDYAGSPVFELFLGSIGADQTTRWQLEYNAVSEFQTYDPASADETLNQNEGEGSNPLRLRKVTLAATAGNFAADDLCLLNIIRLSNAAADSSFAGVMLADVIFRYSDV